MMHLAISLFSSSEQVSNMGLWLFLSVGAVSLFVVFIPLVSWISSRKEEREAFYKAETLRRITESTGEGAKFAMELLREEARRARIQSREGVKIGGLINLGVGLALVIFLRVLLGSGAGSPFLCGLIPGLIGVAMLVYVYLLAAPIE
ncbi:MAG TPA: hypothetical protein VGG26_01925 [Terracidiphilus sp.]|jgi:hypothetical protein